MRWWEKRLGIKTTIDRSDTCENVWFLHKNFVVYKDRVSFPQDVMKKICYFEIPCHPADWSVGVQCNSILYCSPSTPCDVFLKNQYFQGMDTKGTGTVLIGIKSISRDPDAASSPCRTTFALLEEQCMEVRTLKRSILQRLFGIPATKMPRDPECWTYADGKLVIRSGSRR